MPWHDSMSTVLHYPDVYIDMSSWLDAWKVKKITSIK